MRSIGIVVPPTHFFGGMKTVDTDFVIQLFGHLMTCGKDEDEVGRLFRAQHSFDILRLQFTENWNLPRIVCLLNEDTKFW